MNRTEYLNELGKRLKYIPKEDREDAIEYYTELISDMGFGEQEDVEARLGSAKEAAKKIIDECTQKHVDEYEENKTAKGRATVVWLSILGILSLPVSLPLAIAVLAVAFAFIAAFVAIFVAFIASAAALIVSGIACFVFMWFAPGMAQKAIVLGSGMCMLALGILLSYGLFYLGRFIIRKIFRRNLKEVKENE